MAPTVCCRSFARLGSFSFALFAFSIFVQIFLVFCLKLPFVFDIVHARTRQIVEALKVFDTFQLLHSAG